METSSHRTSLRKSLSFTSNVPNVRKSLSFTPEQKKALGKIRKSLSGNYLSSRTPLISLLREKLEGTTIEDIKKLESLLNVNEKGEYGVTPIILAISYECTNDVILYLIQNGANVNEKNLVGQTPLFMAVSTSLRLTKLLLTAGARVNIADSLTGRTPLMEAAGHVEDFEVVRLLLTAGASLEFFDSKGRTAADFAEKRGKLDEFIEAVGLPIEEIPFGERTDIPKHIHEQMDVFWTNSKTVHEKKSSSSLSLRRLSAAPKAIADVIRQGRTSQTVETMSS